MKHKIISEIREILLSDGAPAAFLYGKRAGFSTEWLRAKLHQWRKEDLAAKKQRRRRTTHKLVAVKETAYQAMLDAKFTRQAHTVLYGANEPMRNGKACSWHEIAEEDGLQAYLKACNMQRKK